MTEHKIAGKNLPECSIAELEVFIEAATKPKFHTRLDDEQRALLKAAQDELASRT